MNESLVDGEDFYYNENGLIVRGQWPVVSGLWFVVFIRFHPG